MDTTLQLIFRNEDGRLFTISIPNPRADLTEAEITTVMDLVLSKNLFQSTGGALVQKVRARLVSRDSEDLASYEQ
ncbi:MAG TPA: DUF2922 domain-containing protein [Oscillospiraceae bacterium]|nr:DUF2922 domain-containing protein [Oscillospiraceae bacterium]